MDDQNKVVLKKHVKVNVSHSSVSASIKTNIKYFSLVEPRYSNKKPNEYHGVLAFDSLEELKERLNNYVKKGDKSSAPAYLKGLYKGGTSGVFCTTATPFLFVDIDVKVEKEENPHLNDSFKNSQLFEALAQYTVLQWRSNSKKGIGAILYVPQLNELHHKDKDLHRKVGIAITDYLSELLRKEGVKVSFDQAQSKFRQIRYLAQQDEERVINSNPITFKYEIEESSKNPYTGMQEFRYKGVYCPQGGIRQQFNDNHQIENVLIECGFEKVSGEGRYRHPLTTSPSTGKAELSRNIFFNHSQSFSNQQIFDPFGLVLFTNFSGDKSRFLEELNKKGYQNKPIESKQKSEALEVLRNPQSNKKDLFRQGYILKNLSIEDRYEGVEQSPDHLKKYARREAAVKNLIISYKHELLIDIYVSEQLDMILNFADKYKKLIVKAETGTGKTTAFIMNFIKKRKGKRALIVAPLTTIVDQSVKDYDLIGLTGRSEPQDHTRAKTAKLVFATIEQATKHLEDGNNFDYIVVDEVHNLLTANDYKKKAIADFVYLIRDQKVIGLTGTPNNLFDLLGYTMISVKRRVEKKVKINQKQDNRPSAKIVLDHIEKAEGKTIIRLNSTENLKKIKDELLRSKGYQDDEVLLLFSSNSVKNSPEYKEITNKSKFPSTAKIVLTTALIDEGVNVKQLGFTDVVFIENNYAPSPEPVKQFFARFRNQDQFRNYYHYIKAKKYQTPIYWDEVRDYNQRKYNLTKEGLKEFGTYGDLANDDNFYFPDKSINEHYLAYEVYKKFVSYFNIFEFNYYLQQNFNIEIVEEITPVIQTDTSNIEEEKRADRQKVAFKLHNNFNEVCIAVKRITARKELKNKIDDNGEPIENELMDLVQANLKMFELYLGYYYKLQEAGEDNPLDFLTDGEKLEDSRIVSRTIIFKENCNVLDNPKTKTDFKRKRKLEAFIKDIKAKKRLNRKIIFGLWEKQKVVNNESTQNKHLQDLITCYTYWRYDSKKSTWNL